MEEINEKFTIDTGLSEVEVLLPRPGIQAFPTRAARPRYGRVDTEQEWEEHTLAYRGAADRLVEAIDGSTAESARLFYPILFLYRHYIELRLKQLARAGTWLLGQEPPDWKNLINHDLMHFWATYVQGILTELGVSSKLMRATEERIEEFSLIDQGSFSFRYPVDTQGAPSLPPVGPVDLRRVRDVVAGCSAILDEAYYEICERRNAESDYWQNFWENAELEY